VFVESPMKMPKPTDADRARFRALVPAAPNVEVKPMFGNLGAFVNGNMFMGLFGADVGVRLPADRLERLLAEAGAGPFGPATRPMAGYATLPAAWDAEQAATWVDEALHYVDALPAKVAKPRKAKTAKPKPKPTT
jgi:TfoX/Sxy family transcriptional regulator of competence genes